MFKKFLLTITIALTCQAAAASSLEDIKAKISKKSGELAEVDQLLADSDPNRRIAAMEALIESGNLVFKKRAIEVGLFSSDIEMRKAALFAIFQSGGPFRLQLNLAAVSDEESKARDMLSRWGGSWSTDGKKGEYTFTTKKYDAKLMCWPYDRQKCTFILSGDTVSLRDWGSATGSLTLNNEGQLVGYIQYTRRAYAPVPALIDLTD